MPCSYIIYKDRRLVVTTASEVFTFAEGVAHENQLYSDPDFDPSYSHLIDGSRITKTELTPSELSSLARLTKFSQQSRKAVVAASPVLFGLGRMYQAYLEMSGAIESVRIFKKLDEALLWLGITDEL